MKKFSFALALTSTALMGAAAGEAQAGIFANHVGPLYSGQHYQGGSYLGNIRAISAASHGRAYSGTWLANSAGTRSSIDAYCNTPGCTVSIGWYSPRSGFGVVHNHGNASPSYFSGSYAY